MRIACPFCGERGNEEFVYLGDATLTRPDPGAAGATQAFADYVSPVSDAPRRAMTRTNTKRHSRIVTFSSSARVPPA